MFQPIRACLRCSKQVQIHSPSVKSSISSHKRSIYIPNDGMYNSWYHAPFTNENHIYAKPNEKGITVARFPSHLIDEPTLIEDRSTYQRKSYQSLSFHIRVLGFQPEDMARLSSRNINKQHKQQTDQHISNEQVITLTDSQGLHPCPLILPPLDKLIFVSVITGKRSLLQTAELCNGVRRKFSALCNRIFSEHCLPGHMIWISTTFPALIMSDADLECELINALKQCNLLNKKVSYNDIMSITPTVRHSADSKKTTNQSNNRSARYPSVVWYKSEMDKRTKLEAQEIARVKSQSQNKSKKASGNNQSNSLALPIALALRSKWNESKYKTINPQSINQSVNQSLTNQLLAVDDHLRPERLSREGGARNRPWSARQSLDSFNTAANQPFNPKQMRGFSHLSWPAVPVDRSVKFLIKCMYDRFNSDHKADTTWVADQLSEICIWSKMIDIVEADANLNNQSNNQSSAQTHSVERS